MSIIDLLRRLVRIGLAAYAALALGAASQAQDAPEPDWTPEQWNLLLNNAWHTQGRNSYSFRQRWFADYDDARRAYTGGHLYAPREAPSPTYARNLLEVDPALRFALARLFRNGDLSPPLRHLNAAGEPNGWMVLELTELGELRKARADESFKRDARQWIQRGWMPAPGALANDSAEASRRAYWPARSLETLAGVPAGLSADIEFGDGSTPLTLALMQGNLPLAKALFARGASVHRCGLLGCPLTAATLYGKSEALALVNWLLEQGARPDQRDPRCTDIADDPLAAAIVADNRAVAERLLVAGAPINGLPQTGFTPLEFAVLGKRQDWGEWLLDRGASALPHAEVPARNIVSYAALTQDSTLRRWAEARVLAATEQHPGWRVEVAVEQAGKRLQPDARGLLVLKAAPFELIFGLPESSGGVVMGASLDPAWLEEVRRGDRRNAMFNHLGSGALLSAESPGSDYLLADRACPAGVPAEGQCGGAFMHLRVKHERRQDFHAVRDTPGGPQQVRRVQSLIPLGGDGSRLPVQRLAGQTLHLAVALPVPVDAASGTTVLLPQLRTLRLQFAGQALPPPMAPEGLRSAAGAGALPEGWVADALGCRFEGVPGLSPLSVRWSGDCRNRLGEGQGEFRLMSGSVLLRTYTGGMKGGRFAGMGVLVTGTGRRYEGEFVDGQLSGPGKLTLADGTITSGHFVTGQLSGSCTLTWTAGDRFDGQCRDGWPARSGQILFANGDKYEGAIGQGQASGRGRYRWAGGDVYEGDFIAGQPSGSGDYRFQDGGRYTGNFRLGLPWGQGRVQGKDGTVFTGEVDNGQPGPSGSYSRADGSQLPASPVLRAQLRQPYAEVQMMKPSWIAASATALSADPPRRALAAASSFCMQMGKPTLPPVNWAGVAQLRVLAEVKGGQVRVVRVEPKLAPPDAAAESKFVDAVTRTVNDSYICSGEHLFEQEFEFKVK